MDIKRPAESIGLLIESESFHYGHRNLCVGRLEECQRLGCSPDRGDAQRLVIRNWVYICTFNSFRKLA